MNKKLLVTLSVVAASAALALPASAKGGSGGGGGGGGTGGGTPAPSVGAIRSVSGTAICDHGTMISVTLSKGFNKRVEARIVPVVEGTNDDGTPAGSAWWRQGVFNNTTGASIGGWGGNMTMAPGLVQTNLLGSVPVGVSELTYTATRQTLADPFVIDLNALANQPIVETCTVTLTVTAK